MPLNNSLDAFVYNIILYDFIGDIPNKSAANYRESYLNKDAARYIHRGVATCLLIFFIILPTLYYHYDRYKVF